MIRIECLKTRVFSEICSFDWWRPAKLSINEQPGFGLTVLPYMCGVWFNFLSVEILETRDFLAKCLNFNQLKIIVRLSYYANKKTKFYDILNWLQKHSGLTYFYWWRPAI